MRLFTSCAACSLGNLKKNPPPSRSETRATAIAYRLHADTSGIIRPSTSSGYRRVLVVVDDASRWVFVALLRRADMLSTSTALRRILRDASQGESVLRTKLLRTDNGTEFKNELVDRLLAEADITRELTCVGTSRQNPIAERTIGVLFGMARVMLVDASLPATFWGEAIILTAAHVRNRMPCVSNTDQLSPYEVRFGRRPDLSYFRPFGVTSAFNITSRKYPRAVSVVYC